MTFADQLRQEENERIQKDIDEIKHHDNKLLSDTIRSIETLCSREARNKNHELKGCLYIDRCHGYTDESRILPLQRKDIPPKYKLGTIPSFDTSLLNDINNPQKFEEQLKTKLSDLGFIYYDCSLFPVRVSQPCGTVPFWGGLRYKEIGTKYVIWVHIRW